ncbi:hypothetical protein [uncultured Cedecea sp.]|uniref:hypothetical protein n=1 Tax=uncultured Cedecea sp. TaxID=988762 RepID=UPI0026088DD8|nr:hypothetical protein [uncultured Cedecea sp.]
MSTGNLSLLAQAFLEVWLSRRLGAVGTATIKLIKMGAKRLPDEYHPEFNELLVVVDGEMERVADAQTV